MNVSTLRYAIHVFHNGGPLGWSGNEPHQSEASKVKTMKQDITKAIQFSNTFRYMDDLFSATNVDFGNYISAIYPSELELKDTSTSST